MYDWSKDIVNKISEANCLPEKYIRVVEIALRMYEIHNDILNECIGLAIDDKYELQHKRKMQQ